jgi:polyhydroxyalkanoate synthesis regulator phasin
MARQDLTTAAEAAEELRSILTADENLPEWVQAKITKAMDYLDTTRDYMKAKEEPVDELARIKQLGGIQ